MFKRSLDETMNDPLMFEVVHNGMFSINNMTDRELRESIIHDILLVTMVEKEENTKVDFAEFQLFKWIKPYQHSRVLKEMNDSEIAGLFHVVNGQLRIKDNSEILQAAMDYCGHWYEGFPPPEGTEGVFRLNTEAFQSELNASGGDFDKFCNLMVDKLAPELMDLEANTTGTKTVN